MNAAADRYSREPGSVDSAGMTKSVVMREAASAVVREPRPFLYLKPARWPLRTAPVDGPGLQQLEAEMAAAMPQLVRLVVDKTIARHNRHARARGHVQPIQMSVLNRRRRAARSWLLAIAAGSADAATCHAVATQWLPLLCGTGPDLARAVRPGRALIEFVRGAITACLFVEPSENLLPAARALHVLEQTLAAHLTGLMQNVRATVV